MSKSASDRRPRGRCALLRLGNRRGAMTLEFALVALPFFMLLLGAMDLGRYWYTVHALRNYSADAARAAFVYVNHDPIGRCTAVVPVAVERSPGLNPDDLTAATARCQRNQATGVTEVTVTAGYRFRFAMGLLGIAEQVLTEQQTLEL